jgi:iron complex transport system ATP-binding protein
MILTVDQLSCSLGGRLILEQVSFTLHPNEVVVLLGRNGAGKSTLLHALTGFIPLKSGTVQVGGRDMAPLSLTERAAYFSLLTQKRSASFPFDAIDFVLMGRARHIQRFERPTSHDYALAEKALHQAGAEHLALQNVNTLSGGEYQRVLLARTLLQDAAILLLDEPTTHLDFSTQHHFVSLIRDLAKRLNKGLLVVLHDPNLAFKLADRVILLELGRVVGVASPDELLTSERMSALFGSPVRRIDLEENTLFLPDTLG